MRHATVLLACFLAVIGTAAAAELAGVSMPDEIVVDGNTLVLNGLGLREATFLKVDVYVGGLYLEQPSSSASKILASEQIKRIHMHFVYKKVDRRKIIKGWNEGVEANVANGLELYAQQMQQLNDWMETMLQDDIMVFTAMPGQGLTVEVKGHSKGVIADDDFARDFWTIWLGPKPPNAGLKEGLLGKE